MNLFGAYNIGGDAWEIVGCSSGSAAGSSRHLPAILPIMISLAPIERGFRESGHFVGDDPSDDKFIDCALAGKADYLVSGDRHLLALGQAEGIPILTVASFLRELRPL